MEQLQTGLSCGIGCYDYVGSPGFFDKLFFVLISHFHHLVADKIYTHHKNLLAGQHARRRIQEELALELHAKAGVPLQSGNPNSVTT
jgi:hypothetical protein